MSRPSESPGRVAMIPDELAAVILAAGRSRRMGTPKALLRIAGSPLVEYSLDAFARAGVRRIVVVLGPDADIIRRATRLDRVHVVLNPAPERGPFSSLALALSALRDENGALPGAYVLP